MASIVAFPASMCISKLSIFNPPNDLIVQSLSRENNLDPFYLLHVLPFRSVNNVYMTSHIIYAFEAAFWTHRLKVDRLYRTAYMQLRELMTQFLILHVVACMLQLSKNLTLVKIRPLCINTHSPSAYLI